MADLPTLPLFVDDYEAATAHLTLEEDGAYTRLLRLCWRTPGCSIPDDDEWIARRMRVDSECMARVVKPILKEFFSRSRGRWFQKRLRAEFGYVTARVQARKDAGKRGGDAKAAKSNKKPSSNAKVLPEQNPGKTVAPNPTHFLPSEASSDDADDCASAHDPTFLELACAAAGSPLGQLSTAGGGLGNQADGFEAQRWRSDLGLTDEEILASVREQAARLGRPPSRLRYFTKGIEELAGRKQAGPLSPIAPPQPARASPPPGKTNRDLAEIAMAKLEEQNRLRAIR